MRIEQPTANKATVGAFVAVAGYVLLILISNVNQSPFRVLLVTTLLSILLYAYRVVRVVAIADGSSIEVRNLLATDSHRWTDVRSIEVGPSPRGAGFGVNLHLNDGSIAPIEASWGVWYKGRGKIDTPHARECAEVAEQLTSLARHGEPG